MTSETLQEAIHARPFVPFVLYLADGRLFSVPHPDFIAHPPGRRTAVVFGEGERTHFVDLLSVASLDHSSEPTAADNSETKG
jgi:hypothetical protein